MKRSGRRGGRVLAARSLHWRRNCRCVCDRRSASTSRRFLTVLLARLRRCARPSLSDLKSKSDPASRSRPTAHSSRRVQERSALAKLSSCPSLARAGCCALSGGSAGSRSPRQFFPAVPPRQLRHCRRSVSVRCERRVKFTCF